MLINLKEIRKDFTKNVYSKYIHFKYGIDSVYCNKKIFSNYLFSELTEQYNDVSFKGILDDIDITETSSIVTNNVVNNITNITNITNTGSGAYYTFHQTIAANVWNVTHNLGMLPSEPLITDLDNNNIEAVVNNLNLNTTTITFSHPQNGYAYFS